MTGHADIEMRWVQAWSDLYEITGPSADMRCILPDGQLVDVEVCKGWLQDSAYQGWLVKVEEGQQDGQRIVIASRWKPSA
jgi:hypothetical protein